MGSWQLTVRPEGSRERAVTVTGGGQSTNRPDRLPVPWGHHAAKLPPPPPPPPPVQLEDRDKPILFSMARLDKVKNLTGGPGRGRGRGRGGVPPLPLSRLWCFFLALWCSGRWGLGGVSTSSPPPISTVGSCGTRAWRPRGCGAGPGAAGQALFPGGTVWGVLGGGGDQGITTLVHHALVALTRPPHTQAWPRGTAPAPACVRWSTWWWWAA